MLNVRNVIGSCIFALVLTEVTSWTIDLPVARKFYFERSQQKRGDKNKIYFNHQPDLSPYDNIVGNSLHNTPHRDLHYGNYAHEYGYLSYMEKKVLGIFNKGSIYLEGLRRAMERYSEQLENCTRLERSRPPTNRTWIPEPAVPQQLSPAEEARLTSCEKVTRDSEHVRRLASLVVWAIKELQDISYAKDYDKKTKESEEYVLLLQLAWALDELARLTGFEPDPSEFATEPTPAPAPTTTPATFFNLPIPNDGPTNANCIKQKSPVPATVRCAVPVPAVVLQFLNITNSSSIASNTSQAQDIVMRMLTTFNQSDLGSGPQPFDNKTLDEIRQQMLGCLSGAAAGSTTCAAFAAFIQFLNNNGQLQTYEPRQSRDTNASQLEILEEAEQNSVLPIQKPRSKRSTNDPLKQFVMYFGKYKAWTNSNPHTIGGKPESLDVKNDLTAVKTVRKRSIAKPGIRIRVPEDPMQDLSSYPKHQLNVHYIKDTAQANEIKTYFEKLHPKDIEKTKDHVRKLNQYIKSVHKRSIYYQKLHRPRVPEDPMQDISYYVKNKPGTNIRPNLIHAARVRLGLQEIFERGNIEIINRYGSNYIPGVQPFMMGAIESTSDI